MDINPLNIYIIIKTINKKYKNYTAMELESAGIAILVVFLVNLRSLSLTLRQFFYKLYIAH